MKPPPITHDEALRWWGYTNSEGRMNDFENKHIGAPSEKQAQNLTRADRLAIAGFLRRVADAIERKD